jgi:DNA-binding PadR family transcriptional regulator
VSATRLLVLGCVRMHGSAHGYQVRRDLLTWSADKWANVAPGSIYHALKKMAQEKLLEVVSSEPHPGGPDRTAYQLTPDGETEFQLLLARYLAESDSNTQGAYQLAAAVTFLPALPRKKAISLLQHRLTRLAGHRNSADDMLENATEWGQPPHVEELYRLWSYAVEAEERWVRQLLTRLMEGAYVMDDDEGVSFGRPTKQI